MEQIKKFILPENTNKLYKEEAISSIGLTREVADKINELVDAYNTFAGEDLEWKQTQEGIIRKGVLFMKDNLANSIYELLKSLTFYNLMNENTQALIIKRSEDLKKQINALASGAPLVASSTSGMTDKSRTYVNTTDGKWYYWNGSAWASGGAYQGIQIQDDAVTTSKRTVLGDYGFLMSEQGSITVDVNNLTVTVNKDHVFIYRDHIITVADGTSLQLPSKQPYMLYFDIENRDIRFHRPSDDLHKASENCVYIGYISISETGYTQINCPRYDVIFNGKKTSYVNGSMQKPTRVCDLLSGKVAIDTSTKKITFTSAVYSLGHRYVTISSEVTYEEVNSARIKYVVYDTTSNSVKVYENRNTENLDEVLLFAFYNGKLYHSYVNRHLYTINGKGEGNPSDKLFGKTATFIGDSIVRGAGANKPFTSFVAEQTSLSVTNQGVDGSCVADKNSETVQSFIDRLPGFQGADIIGIMGGTNDYWNGVEIGDVDSLNTFTFCGALNHLLEDMITKNPGAFIFFMTPPPAYRSADRIAEGFASFPYPTNVKGKTFDDYCEAIKKVCAKYAVPVLDLKHTSGLCPMIPSEDARLYHDGVHLNIDGYQHLGKIVSNFILAEYR